MSTLTWLCLAVAFMLLCSSAAADQKVWNILHAYGAGGKVTVEKLREFSSSVNAVEIDMLYHTDRFWAAHDYEQCDANYTDRSSVCLDLEPLLQEVEANVNITLLWIDPKGQRHWGERNLSHLAVYVRSIVKTKAVWWGVGESGPLSTGDLEELVAVDPLPALEGYSFDYGKNSAYYATVQDVYLRARKAGMTNIGYSNKPGFNLHSCDELNKAMAYRAEGKLGRVLIWTINDGHRLQGLYQANGATFDCSVGAELDEPQLVGAVDGIISDYYTGMRTQQTVVKDAPQLHMATSNDPFWQPEMATASNINLRQDNVLANGGAEMTPMMPNGTTSSWRLNSTTGSGVLSLSAATDCPSTPPFSGDRYFALKVPCTNNTANTATESMYQDIVMNAYSTEIDAGNMSITVSAAFFYRNPDITAALVLEYVGLDANVSSAFEWHTDGAQLNTWGVVEETTVLPRGARVARLHAKATVDRSTACTSSGSAIPDAACSQQGPYLLVDKIALMVYPTSYVGPSDPTVVPESTSSMPSTGHSAANTPTTSSWCSSIECQVCISAGAVVVIGLCVVIMRHRGGRLQKIPVVDGGEDTRSDALLTLPEVSQQETDDERGATAGAVHDVDDELL